MFSGRWEDSLARDEDGRIFFDFNPQYFVYILDYLRSRTIATAENPAPFRPKLAEDQVKHFGDLVEYLGLGDEIVVSVGETNEIVPTEIVPPERFNLHGTGVTIQEGGKVVINSTGHKYVLGENTYQRGIVRRKLKIESFQSNDWMVVGVVKAGVVPQNDNSHKCPGSYGWTLGSTRWNFGVWKDGSPTNETTLQNLTKQGDTIELVLDCDAAKLSLYLPSGHQIHIDLPKSQTWRLYLNLHGHNDKIRIVEA
jgi:hypothetical protein